MTKKELIEKINEKTEERGGIAILKTHLNQVLESLPSVAAEALAKGGTFEIPGVVRLSVAERPARTGRNPRTGETIQIPAKRVVKAKVPKGLEESVGYYETVEGKA